jgi:hypothetical protein
MLLYLARGASPRLDLIFFLFSLLVSPLLVPLSVILLASPCFLCLYFPLSLSLSLSLFCSLSSLSPSFSLSLSRHDERAPSIDVFSMTSFPGCVSYFCLLTSFPGCVSYFCRYIFAASRWIVTRVFRSTRCSTCRSGEWYILRSAPSVAHALDSSTRQRGLHAQGAVLVLVASVFQGLRALVPHTHTHSHSPHTHTQHTHAHHIHTYTHPRTHTYTHTHYTYTHKHIHTNTSHIHRHTYTCTRTPICV